MASAAEFPQLAGTQRLLACDLGDVDGDRAGVVALQQLRGHPQLAGPADLDRAQHALRCDGADLVQVWPRHATGVDRVEIVTSRTTFDEELPALCDLLAIVAQLVLLEVRRVALARAARRDHDGGHGDPDADVGEHDQDPEWAPAAREVGLARSARAAREGDEHDADPDQKP